MTDTLQLNRIPATNHPSLKAWNAADELLIQHVEDKIENIAIYNDSFGYLSCHLSRFNPTIITDLKSQQEAISKNLEINNKEVGNAQFLTLEDGLPFQPDQVLFQIPKSISLFEVYLQHIHTHLSNSGQVLCGFMTKYFNSSLLNVAKKYFEHVDQSRAQKKARLLMLSGKKEVETADITERFKYHNLDVKQYKGVFSARKIDKATDYLLQHLQIPDQHEKVLDLACGNGIIGRWIMEKTPVEAMHFLDDSLLAVNSARLNVKEANAHFHHNYQLDDFDNESLDWVITNPPFHFGNTIDTSIPINLFRGAYHKLVSGGILTIVANSNLGYESFLKHQFKSVSIQKSNRQFKIYNCCK